MSAARIETPAMNSIEISRNSLDWSRISVDLHEAGWARTGEVLTEDECRELRQLYVNDRLFRSKVVITEPFSFEA